MRASLKIAVPLTVTLVVASLTVAVYRVQSQRRTLRNDLSSESEHSRTGSCEKVEPLDDTREAN